MPVESEMARKRRGRERVRAMRESVIGEDHHGEDEAEDGGGGDEGSEEDGGDLVDSEDGRVGNGLEVLLMGDECGDGDMREKLEEEDGLGELPLGSREADEGEDEEDGLGGGELPLGPGLCQ